VSVAEATGFDGSPTLLGFTPLLLITGATGTGKSVIACALAHHACRRGYRGYYRRVSRLFDDLRLARADGTYGRLLGKLARMDVLVLDDWASWPARDLDRRRVVLESS
jgi:DNA replication protein DnaC